MGAEICTIFSVKEAFTVGSVYSMRLEMRPLEKVMRNHDLFRQTWCDSATFSCPLACGAMLSVSFFLMRGQFMIRDSRMRAMVHHEPITPVSGNDEGHRQKYIFCCEIHPCRSQCTALDPPVQNLLVCHLSGEETSLDGCYGGHVTRYDSKDNMTSRKFFEGCEPSASWRPLETMTSLPAMQNYARFTYTRALYARAPSTR